MVIRKSDTGAKHATLRTASFRLGRNLETGNVVLILYADCGMYTVELTGKEARAMNEQITKIVALQIAEQKYGSDYFDNMEELLFM